MSRHIGPSKSSTQRKIHSRKCLLLEKPYVLNLCWRKETSEKTNHKLEGRNN